MCDGMFGCNVAAKKESESHGKLKIQQNFKKSLSSAFTLRKNKCVHAGGKKNDKSFSFLKLGGMLNAP